VTLTDLTFLILQLNAVVDEDLHRGIPMDEVQRHIEAGDLFAWLATRFGNSIDLSLYGPGARPEVAAEITEGLNSILGGYQGRERRKWGVENNGICLLIAWVNELVQQRAWKDR